MMKNIFEPKSIAVVGASRHKGKVGYDIFKNLLSSRKKVYPVNPNAKKICGRIVYSSLLDIKDKIDLVVIVVPAKFVPSVLEECGKKKIKNAIIISAGFSETGNEELEKEIVGISAKYNIRFLGPNCLGVINSHQNMNSTFFSKMPSKGNIAFVSQSGALGVAVLDWLIKNKLGLSSFVSVGNMTDINFSEIIQYLDKDKKTSVICLYIESLKDGKRFLEVVSKTKKPVIVLKGGMTETGQKAAATHTAALASEAGVYSGAFKQCNAIQVNSLYELFELARYLSNKKAPKGNRGLIITNAGGVGVLTSDAFEMNNIQIAKLPDRIIKKLDKVLPQEWSKSNPVDIVGDATPERYKDILNAVKNEKFYDFIFLALTPQSMTNPTKVAEILIDFHKKTNIPCFGCFMGGELIAKSKLILKRNDILNFKEPFYGVEIISKMVK